MIWRINMEHFQFEEFDEFDAEPLEEELYPITMTRNEILFLDDSMTMLIEHDGYTSAVTTMRMLVPSATLPAPISLIEKIGLGVLHVTDPEQDNPNTIIHLDATEIYMLREICYSYSKIGLEQVGYNLKRKFYQALYQEEYNRNLKINKLLDSIEETIITEE